MQCLPIFIFTFYWKQKQRYSPSSWCTPELSVNKHFQFKMQQSPQEFIKHAVYLFFGGDGPCDVTLCILFASCLISHWTVPKLILTCNESHRVCVVWFETGMPSVVNFWKKYSKVFSNSLDSWLVLTWTVKCRINLIAWVNMMCSNLKLRWRSLMWGDGCSSVGILRLCESENAAL